MGRRPGPTHPPGNPFAGFLSDRRAELGLTLQRLADRTGLHRNTVARWATASAPPLLSGPVVEALAGALDVPPEVVLERAELLPAETLHHLVSSGYLADQAEGVSGGTA